MTSETSDLKKQSTNVAYRFLGGAALGAFMVIIPYLLTSRELNLPHVGAALLLIASCGLLSSLWGKKFIEALMRSLESSGLY
jgi:DNA polymerase sigma